MNTIDERISEMTSTIVIICLTLILLGWGSPLKLVPVKKEQKAD